MAAILAGGRARRYGGAHKASLPVGGARIIDRQLAALSSVADDIRIVANQVERYGGLGARVIPDAIAGALCAVYHRRCAGVARSRIERGILQVAAIVEDLRVCELGPETLAAYDAGALFTNVNTPHDHECARGWVELNEKPSEDPITE